MDKKDEISDRAKQLIILGKILEEGGYELFSKEGDEANRELVLKLIAARKKIARKKRRTKIDIILNKLLDYLIKEQEKEDKKSKEIDTKEHGSTKNLEQELAADIAKLRSVSGNNNDLNDLRILQSMAAIANLVNTLSDRGSAAVNVGNQALSLVSVAANATTIANATNQEKLIIGNESVSKSLRMHLDEPNKTTHINELPITDDVKERKRIEKEKYLASMAALKEKQNKG